MNHVIGSVSCLALSIIVMPVAIIHIIVKNKMKINFVDDFICGCFKCFKNGRLSFNRPNYINLLYCFANSTILRSNEPVSCKDVIDWSTSNPLRWFIYFLMDVVIYLNSLDFTSITFHWTMSNQVVSNHKQYSLRAYDLVYFQHHVNFILKLPSQHQYKWVLVLSSNGLPGLIVSFHTEEPMMCISTFVIMDYD